MIIIFIRNRQRKRSFPACGTAVKLHFIVPWKAAEKSPKGAPPLDSGDGLRPPNLPRGPSPPGPSSPFPQRQVCYDKDVTLRRICTYAVKWSAIWLPLLGRQIRAVSSYFRYLFLFRIYLGSQTIFTRMQFYLKF